MSEFYEGFRNKKHVAVNQSAKNGEVKKAKAGRPSKPTFKKYLIALDQHLHGRLADHASSLGVARSFVISEALKQYLTKN